MELSEYLTKRFKDQGEAAETFGVSQGTISHWVTGRRRPSPEKARQIVEHSGGELTLEGVLYRQADQPRAAA